MEINEDLIKQWEPKIQRMLLVWFVPGFTRDDLAQELRIAIIKTSKAFKTDKNSIFLLYSNITN